MSIKQTFYYHEFTGADRKLYRLGLVVGDTSDYTGTGQAEFPPQLVEKADVTIESAFDDDRIHGLQETSDMKVTLQLTWHPSNTGSNNELLYNALKYGIAGSVSGGTFTPATRAVAGTDGVYVPNRWSLERWEPNTSSWTLIFVGLEDVKPATKFTTDSSFTILEITAIDLARYVYERIDMDFIKSDILSNPTNDVETLNYLIYTYNSTTYKTQFSEVGSDVQTIKMHALGYVVDGFVYPAIRNYFDAVLRGCLNTLVNNLTWPYQSEVYYEQADNTTATKGAEITDVSTGNKYEVYYIAQLLDVNNNVIGGMWSENESISFYNYDNIWDLIKDWTDGCLTKCRIEYDGSDASIDVGLRWELCLNDYSNAQTLTSDDYVISDSIEIERSAQIIRASACHIQGGLTGLNAITIEYDDPQKVEYNINGILDQETEEIKPILHNQTPGPTNPHSKDNKFYYTQPIINGIYWKDSAGALGAAGAFYMVSDYIDIKLSDSTTISPETSYDNDAIDTLPPYPDYIYWIRERLAVSGPGYVKAKALQAVYGKRNQALIKCSIINTALDEPTTLLIGEQITIDPDDLVVGGATLSDIIGATAYLVKSEFNPIEGKSNILLYVIGDHDAR